MLRSITEELKDGENNAVMFDHGYEIRGNEFSAALAEILDTHGREICLLPLSAMSSGDGVFQHAPVAGRTVIAVRLAPVASPKVHTASCADLPSLALDEIVIDGENRCIHAGAGITLEQLNVALADTLGPSFRVLGADLTSYQYAQVGATFMTGGMGPQRRYFSDSVERIALFDGEQVYEIGGEQLAGYAGTFGWTGIVTALSCRFVELPGEEFAFAIPIDDSARQLGRLLGLFAPYCFLENPGNSLVNSMGGGDIVLGLEHITADSMQPMIDQGSQPRLIKRAQALLQKCRTEHASGVIFVNGFSPKEPDELIVGFLDDADSDEPTIAGISLDNTEFFPDAEEMRLLREAIPYAARTQAPSGDFVYKNHTDLTIRLHPDEVEAGMALLWQYNGQYVSALNEYFTNSPDVDGQVLVYGHMNPWGVDPHNRVTLASSNRQAFESAVKFAGEGRARYYRDLNTVCEQHQATYVGGEKGVGSESKIHLAFGAPENSPANLQHKFRKQQLQIHSAAPMFNWRALKPYTG